MIIVMIFNIINKKVTEKQYLEEYKEIIKECLNYDVQNEDTLKKKASK